MTTTTTSDDLSLVDPTRTYLRAAAVVEDVDVERGIVEAKIVPYEVEADLGDGLHEIFTRGAFSAAVGNPSRCKVTDQQHNRSINIGKAIELRDEPDALYGKLKIADTSAGRDNLVLMREEVLTELSVEFRALARKYDVVRRGPADILVRHHKAELLGVSPVGAGAYGDQARVLMVRCAEQDRAREKALAFLATLNSGPNRE
jgi:HK97 family phage prohead protease